MGVYYCCHCGKGMCGEWFCCKACTLGEGGGSVLCQECAFEDRCHQCEEKVCVYCVKETKDKFSCCGMILCGGGTDVGSKDTLTCISKHVMKTLSCGHKTCNFPIEDYEEEESGKDVEGKSDKEEDVEGKSDKEEDVEGKSEKEEDIEESGKDVTGEKEEDEEMCYKCLCAKVEEEARKEDVAVIESIMLKIKSRKIKSMLQDIVDDPEGKKRERNNERLAELQLSLRKANNAYVACRCDARYLYY